MARAWSVCVNVWADKHRISFGYSKLLVSVELQWRIKRHGCFLIFQATPTHLRRPSAHRLHIYAYGFRTCAITFIQYARSMSNVFSIAPDNATAGRNTRTYTFNEFADCCEHDESCGEYAWRMKCAVCFTVYFVPSHSFHSLHSIFAVVVYVCGTRTHNINERANERRRKNDGP